MTNKIKIYLLILQFLFTYCDKIEPPFTENLSQDTSVVKIKRKILLEDYTGHTCPNCPRAAEIAHNMQSVYGNSLIVMSVHAGYFATPGNPPFNNDLRCATSIELDNFFGVSAVGNPNGMINRVPYNNSKIINPDLWLSAFIIQNNNDKSTIKIDIQNTYILNERKLLSNIQTEFLDELTGTYMLAVYIIEDSIVSSQKNNDPDIGSVPVIIDYVHRNVLRASINSTFGDTIANGNINKGYYKEKTYSKTLNSNWNENQCYVLAYIYDHSSYEILQSEIKKIK